MKDIKVLEIPDDLPVRNYGKLSNKQRVKYWVYIISLLWFGVGCFCWGFVVGSGK